MVTRSGLPQNYIVRSPEIIADFETIGGVWSKSGTGNLIADTINFRSGVQSMKLETTAPETAVRGYCSTINWKPGLNRYIAFWYYIPDSAKIYNIEFIISSVTNLSKYLKYTEGVLSTGWNQLIIRPNQWTVIGGDSLENEIVYIRLAVQSRAGQTSYVSFDSVEVNEGGLPRALIMFDDGRSSQYDTAKTILDARGLKATFYIVSDWVGTAGKMTLANLQALYADGHAISNHTSDHTSLSTLSEADQELKIATCRDYLLANGISRSANHLSYPYGTSNADTITAKANTFVLTSRSLNVTTIKGHECLNHNLGVLIQLTDVLNIATTLAAIDTAIASGSTFCLLAHGLDDGGPSAITTADFTTIMDYLVQKRVRCVTIDEWYNGLTNPRYRSLPLTRA